MVFASDAEEEVTSTCHPYEVWTRAACVACVLNDRSCRGEVVSIRCQTRERNTRGRMRVSKRDGVVIIKVLMTMETCVRA